MPGLWYPYAINNTSYILIELPSYISANCKDTLFQLRIRGYHPILAHPERHPDIIRRPKILIEMLAPEILVQITADSLVGTGSGLPCRNVQSIC